MIYENCHVKLDKKKCLDKAYFDKMLKKFTFEVKKTEVMETIRLKRRYLKPSQLRKIKKELAPFKWKFYK